MQLSNGSKQAGFWHPHLLGQHFMRSVMQSCSSALCFLILLTTTFSTGSESAVTPVKVKLHDSATLPCSERCSGLARWTVFHKRSDTLAECDQTSCRSVKEGYQMIHDQYLKGNLSLTITDADFTKRARYTCDCDDKDLCDVHLQIEPLKTPVQKKNGESLLLKLDVSDPVAVIYNSTGAAIRYSGQICTVKGRSTQCKDEYTQRASLTSALELRGVTPSDSGDYTVMDTINNEAIHTYTLTIKGGAGSEAQDQIYKFPRIRRSAPSDGELCRCRDQGAALPGWIVPVLSALVAVLLAVCAASVGMNVWQRREIRQLQMKPEGSQSLYL
ncbi:uncharacterized protein LOC108412412 isoform X1 [Pygocentrus nattereri]|uniref:uncharacterized protein LOC108412412 isoform X1 n=1 Tax=Pygocentrus nattereri TaxID=42514 RepID=UPI0018919DB0|nr:uncharacterized protein LOC108412412 isoform X1 [Pygocentrus nattereri]XP_017539899.2 uncharacterized protein LOC108412412 isoform X1 [Pygocentrus nattereri]XP_017539900.2 uncharacterized protein LOC108412412 isoform X1 [Pygocentrus nattereri]